jgi:hypothetical protein
VPALAAQMRRLVLRPSSSRSTVFQQSRVSAWGNAEAGFEMPRHMALIGEACGDGGPGKSKPADDPSANPKETPADEMAMRRSTHLRAEAASEAEGVDAGLAVQILRDH